MSWHKRILAVTCVCLLFTRDRADADRIRQAGRIAWDAAPTQKPTQTLSRLDRCLARGSSGHANAVIRAQAPVIDIASRSVDGAFLFSADASLGSQIYDQYVMWVYGRLVLAHPNDRTLTLVDQATVENAKNDLKHRDAPITEWTAESPDQWVSNPFAIRFEFGMFRLVDLSEQDVLDEPLRATAKPYRLRDIERRGHEIAIMQDPPLLSWLIPTYRGEVTVRISAIEVWTGHGTACFPAQMK